MAAIENTAQAPQAPQADGPLVLAPVETVPQWEDPTRGADHSPPSIPEPPDCRSPQEFTCSEQTAIRVLVKHYGWVVCDIGKLSKWRQS